METAQTATIKPGKKTPGTGMLRDPDKESVFPTNIRQSLDNKKTRKLSDTGYIRNF